jgi:hypothetical protein
MLSCSKCLRYFSLVVFSASAVSFPHTNEHISLPLQRSPTASVLQFQRPAVSVDDGTHALLRSESFPPSETRSKVSKLPVVSDNGAMSAVVSSQGIKYLDNKHNHSSRERLYTVAAEEGELVDTEIRPFEPFLLHVAKNGTTSTHAGGTPNSPNVLYFVIGATVFLVACIAMIFYTQKLGFRQVAGEVVLFQNPQDEEPQAREASQDMVHPGDQIRYRLQQVLISWIFIVASIVYFCDYLALQAGLNKVRHWFGVLASVQWLFGFLILLHWQHSVGTSRTQLGSSHLKAWSCLFQQVHPVAMTMGYKESDSWVWWTAFVGILFWHIGNLISCFDYARNPPAGANRNGSLVSHGNIPVTEVWLDQLATWLLLIAVVSITQWGGHPDAQLEPVTNWGVTFCQFGGATLFLLASVLRCEWCNGFRNFSHRTE